MVANEAAWAALGAAHHASGAASMINTAVTSAAWMGVGSAGSVANSSMLNAAMETLAGWVDVKPGIVGAAISAYELASASMRTAEECEANRTEWASDNAINPAVLGALTPRIVSLDAQYFGVMWPNNAAVGASYGSTLSTLAASLTIPAPPAGMGASPAAPAAAASAVGEATSETAAGAGMRAAYEGTQAAGTGAGQGASAAQDLGGQVSTLMGPVQEAMSSVTQLPSSLGQLPQAAFSPAQSMMGMFMNPSMFGAMGAAAPAAAVPGVSAASVTGGGALGAGGGGAGGLGVGGGGGVPSSAFTRPVSAFEPGGSGRPVGLRPSGALGASEPVRPTTTTAAGTGMGGMPMAHGGAGRSEGERNTDRVATVRVVDTRV